MTPFEPLFLETDRLVLRRFTDTEADGTLLLDLDSDPDVMRYIGPFGLDSVEEYRERIRVWLAYYASHPARGVWAAYEKTADFIGWLLLRPAVDHRFAAEAGWTSPADVELGYRFKKSAWGRGLCTEAAAALVKVAFEDPAVELVVAMAMAPNRSSTRVMEKVGMVYEREFRISVVPELCVAYSLSRSLLRSG